MLNLAGMQCIKRKVHGLVCLSEFCKFPAGFARKSKRDNIRYKKINILIIKLKLMF